MILIAVSDKDDLKEELLRFNKVDTINASGTIIYVVRVDNQNVIFTNIGTTKVDVARNFTSINCLYRITVVISVGNCASLDSKYSIGRIAIGIDTMQYDVDFSKLGYPFGMIPDINKRVFILNKKLINMVDKICISNDILAHTGRIISGDKFIASTMEKEKLKTSYNASYLDTESGTLGELTNIYRIPLVIIKGISNYGDNLAVDDYNNKRIEMNIKTMMIAYHMIDEIIKIGY